RQPHNSAGCRQLDLCLVDGDDRRQGKSAQGRRFEVGRNLFVRGVIVSQKTLELGKMHWLSDRHRNSPDQGCTPGARTPAMLTQMARLSTSRYPDLRYIP